MAEQISRYRIVDGNLTEMSDAEYAEELEARNAPIIEPAKPYAGLDRHACGRSWRDGG